MRLEPFGDLADPTISRLRTVFAVADEVREGNRAEGDCLAALRAAGQQVLQVANPDAAAGVMAAVNVTGVPKATGAAAGVSIVAGATTRDIASVALR